MAHDDDRALPRQPIDRLLAPVERFLHVESAGGVVLCVCALVALGLANSPLGPAVDAFWHTPIGVTIGHLQVSHSLEHWVNDGLMVLFFFVIGLEVKREIVLGALSDVRSATLPLVAAVGGMAVPAGVYLALRAGTPDARGWGVPMATDIAFVVGCMAILGRRVPPRLRIMVLAIAIADDIGAILVIAIAYASAIDYVALGLGGVGIALVGGLRRLGVRSLIAYALVGFGVWIAFLGSGVHATIAGVILGLLTPAHPHVGTSALAPLVERMTRRLRGDASVQERVSGVKSLREAARETVSPLEFLERSLHPWVAFVVMPVFALANAGVAIDRHALGHPVAVAVAIALVVGKPIGIVAFSWLAVAMRVARLPDGVGWGALVGAGALAGIGFTMALFVADLALVVLADRRSRTA